MKQYQVKHEDISQITERRLPFTISYGGNALKKFDPRLEEKLGQRRGASSIYVLNRDQHRWQRPGLENCYPWRIGRNIV